MATVRQCARCGAELDEYSPADSCPRCMMNAALPSGKDDEPADVPPPLATPFAPRRFGDYELLEEIARGGMGVVYRARQLSLDRLVAVKMLLFGPMASPEVIRRFRVEAVAAGSLHHPNIVAIHEVGIHETQHFLVMDYVDGPNLAKLAHHRPLPAKRVAAYVKTIAEAIHYAHERGLLHRDLKPSNVLIDSNDQPRVTDFGLARRLEGDSSLTLSGQVLGSPNYMSPEQAAAHRGKVSRRSDVYGLGAILYHLLTGRAPFQAENITDTLHRVLDSEPVSPRLLHPHVPADLETICLKCLQKEPERRYATAQDLVDELNRFLNGEPIRARPVTRPEKLWRWCRRKPALAGSLAGALLLLLVVAIGSPIAAYRINQERKRAEAEKLATRQNLYAADMLVVQEALEQGDLGRVRKLLSAHLPRAGEPDLRGFEWRYFWRRSLGEEAAALETDADYIQHLSLSPDGRVLAGGRRIWEVASGHLVHELPSGDQALAFAPTGTVLLCNGKEGWKRLDLSTKEEALTDGSERVRALRFSPTGRWLATGSRRGLTLWEVATWSQHRSEPSIRFDSFNMKGLAFSPDERILITATGNPLRESCELYAWRIPSLEPMPLQTNAVKNVTCIAYEPDGRRFFTGGWDGAVRVWDATTFTESAAQGSLRHHRSWISEIAFLPGTRRLVTAGADRCLRVWDMEDSSVPMTLRGHTDEIWSMAISSDGATLFSASRDRTVKRWEVSWSGDREVFTGHGTRLQPVGLSADGQRLATASDGELKFWELSGPVPKQAVSRGWKPSGLENLPPDPWLGNGMAAISPNFQWLAIARTGQPVELWNVSERKLQRLPESTASAVFVAFSPDSKLVAAMRSTNTVVLWEVVTGREVLAVTPSGESQSVIAAAFAAKTNVAAIAGLHSIRLWDLASLRQLGEVKVGGFVRFAISPDGQTLATGDVKGMVTLYDCPSGKRLREPLAAHLTSPHCLCFSPDGRTLASGGDRRAKLWNLTTYREVASCEHEGTVVYAAFSYDGSKLVTADAGLTIRVWQAPPFAEIERPER